MSAATKPLLEARVTLDVPFCDLDPMQVVWHGNYFRYFERGRQALLDAAGLDLYRIHGDEGYLFPVVRSAVKHIRPLRLRDRFECVARLLEARNKLVIDFELRLLPGGELCARGRTEQVAVRAESGQLEYRIPEAIRRALEGEERA